MNKKSLIITLIAAMTLFAGCGESESAMIPTEEAKIIALEHANQTNDQVTFIRSEIDRDNGKINYDVEFYTADGLEFDYEIDPYSGEILNYDYELEMLYD